MEDVGDIAGQSARVLALLSDADLFASIAAAAREPALTRFCTEEIIPQYERLYRSVV
jgi:hypothetical protein